MYTQEVRGDKSHTLKKYEETQDVRPRIRGKHKPYAQGVGGYARRTLKKYGETQDVHSRVYVLCFLQVLECTSCVSPYPSSVRFVFPPYFLSVRLAFSLPLECTSCVSSYFLSVRLAYPPTP